MARRARGLAFSAAVIAGGALFLAERAAEAQTCGPICARPGHYVLCSDSFDASTTTGGTRQLGVTKDFNYDRLCVGHGAPEATYSRRGAYVLLSPGGLASFCLEVFRESWGAAPTSPIAATVNAQCFQSSVFSATPGWLEFGMSPVPAIQNLTVDLRLCLFDQAGASQRHTYFDADGAAGHNTVFLNPPSTPGWALASDRGVPGDFILRPIVELSDLSPWQPGGACSAGPADAGVADAGEADAGAADAGEDGGEADAGAADAGEDGGEADAGAADAGEADAAAADSGGEPADAAQGDAGTFDVGGTEGDAGVPGAAPIITRVNPNQGLNDRATDVLVTGSGFVSGLSLKVGQIPAVEVSVPGPTTILAKVPAGIAPGVYDVVVQNPDLQAAVLPEGFTVLDPSGVGNLPEDDCGYQSVPASGGSPWPAMALLLGAAFLACTTVPRAVRARVRLAPRRKSS